MTGGTLGGGIAPVVPSSLTTERRPSTLLTQRSAYKSRPFSCRRCDRIVAMGVFCSLCRRWYHRSCASELPPNLLVSLALDRLPTLAATTPASRLSGLPIARTVPSRQHGTSFASGGPAKDGLLARDGGGGGSSSFPPPPSAGEGTSSSLDAMLSSPQVPIGASWSESGAFSANSAVFGNSVLDTATSGSMLMGRMTLNNSEGTSRRHEVQDRLPNLFPFLCGGCLETIALMDPASIFQESLISGEDGSDATASLENSMSEFQLLGSRLDSSDHRRKLEMDRLQQTLERMHQQRPLGYSTLHARYGEVRRPPVPILSTLDPSQLNSGDGDSTALRSSPNHAPVDEGGYGGYDPDVGGQVDSTPDDQTAAAARPKALPKGERVARDAFDYLHFCLTAIPGGKGVPPAEWDSHRVNSRALRYLRLALRRVEPKWYGGIDAETGEAVQDDFDDLPLEEQSSLPTATRNAAARGGASDPKLRAQHHVLSEIEVVNDRDPFESSSVDGAELNVGVGDRRSLGQLLSAPGNAGVLLAGQLTTGHATVLAPGGLQAWLDAHSVAPTGRRGSTASQGDDSAQEDELQGLVPGPSPKGPRQRSPLFPRPTQLERRRATATGQYTGLMEMHPTFLSDYHFAARNYKGGVGGANLMDGDAGSLRTARLRLSRLAVDEAGA